MDSGLDPEVAGILWAIVRLLFSSAVGATGSLLRVYIDTDDAPAAPIVASGSFCAGVAGLALIEAVDIDAELLFGINTTGFFIARLVLTPSGIVAALGLIGFLGYDIAQVLQRLGRWIRNYTPSFARRSGGNKTNGST